jgi:precorrin-3B synthase
MTPRGWCPSVFEPMPTGDGLLVRVKPRGATLSAAQTRLLAAAVARHGNGAIELTGRGNLQIRGLGAADVAPFAAAMLAAGLSAAEPGAERRRNVIASPLAGDDPDVAPDAQAVTSAVEAALEAESLAALPAKFCVAVDGGGLLPLDGVRADILLRHRNGWHVAIDGSARSVAIADAASTVTALTAAFLRLGGWSRMRTLVETVGDDPLFATASLFSPSPCGLGLRSRPRLGGGSLAAPTRRAPSPNPLPQGEGALGVGFLPYPLLARGAVGVGLPFGHLTPSTLEALANLAEQFGDGTLRTSPWRTILLPGVAAADAHAALRAASSRGLIVDPADPRLNVVACVGRPGCASATVDTRADATRLVAAGNREKIHVAGCAKGCAHPRSAPITLVGDRGRYAVVRDGCAGDAPAATGLTIEQVVKMLAAQPVAA